MGATSDASIATSVASKSPAADAKTKSGSTRMSSADWRIFVRDAYATLFDVVGDWAYLYAIYHRDYDGDGDADAIVNFHVDYEIIVNLVLVLCVLSTVFAVWTMFTMFARACGKSSMCCDCTIPKLALAATLLEDVPQLLLTAYIDYGFSGKITPAGMLNISSSLNALVNRATSKYDDIVYEEKNEDGDAYEAMP